MQILGSSPGRKSRLYNRTLLVEELVGTSGRALDFIISKCKYLNMYVLTHLAKLSELMYTNCRLQFNCMGYANYDFGVKVLYLAIRYLLEVYPKASLLGRLQGDMG